MKFPLYWLVCCLSTTLTLSRAQSTTTLASRLTPDGFVEISWPASAPAVQLQATTTLGSGASWLPYPQAPVSSGNQLVLRLAPLDSWIFFRLAPSAGSGAHIIATSPAPGEAGVAVTRETIFRFDQPLNPAAVIYPANVYAEFGERRILSRPEVSSDRLTLTLFYLENLPGSARIKVSLDARALTDTFAPPIDAAQNGDGIFELNFETAGTGALANTAVMGHVYTSELGPGGTNVPLQGAIITVDGAEETLRTVTDATGFFRLQPSPGGRFFVHVDGRSALGSQWPRGAYYPFVGKAWQATPGQTNNLAGGNGLIYLPLVPAEALQAVSPVQDTRITFAPSVLATNPALAGVSVTVPANSLFGENGSRGGKVGIAAVAPDRLPEPLPPGLNLPLVITIQTDGSMNFDRPVPVRFPNLPDPVTGVKLPPGAKTVLWSFNHDTGRWEPQGTATITADGQFAETDPGVGVRQPGWHGIAAGSPGKGPDPEVGGGDPGCQSVGYYDCDGDGCAESTYECDCTPYLNQQNQANDECPLGNILRNTIAGFFCWAPYVNCPPAGWLQKFKDCRDRAANAGDAYNRCLINSGAPLQRQNVPTSQDQDRLIAAAALPNSLLLGSPEWTLVDFAERSKWTALFGSLNSATSESGPGGKPITNAERLSLLALSLPSNITPALVETAIQRLNSFNAGSLAAAETEAIHTAIDTFQKLWAQLQAAGWKTTLDGLFAQEAASSSATALAARRSFFAYRRLHYAIFNLENGFEIRGRLDAQGRFSNVILPPDTYFQVSYLDPLTLATGYAVFKSGLPSNTPTTSIPPALMFLPPVVADSDADGLSDEAEWIVGTAPNQADSDNDGVKDADEIRANLEPLDGFGQAIGALATVSGPGNASEIAIDNDVAAVIGERWGLTLIDIRDPAQPVIVNRIMPGTDREKVALQWPWLLASDTQHAVTLFDLTQMTQPKTVWTYSTRDRGATALAIGFGNAYIADNANLHVLDLLSGRKLWQSTTNGYLRLQLAGNHLFGINGKSSSWRLDILRLEEGGRGVVFEGSLDLEGTPVTDSDSPGLFAADGLVYVTFTAGYRVVDVSMPSAPKLVGGPTQARQPDIITLARDGGNFLVASTTSSGPPLRRPSIYDATNPSLTTNLLSSFDTPGEAYRIVLYKSRLFLGDGSAGFTTANYRPREFGTNPPVVTLAAYPTFSNPSLQASGDALRVAARAVDDVLTDRVEFYIDGVRAATAGSYPFETDLIPPTLTATKKTFTLRAKAFDTAGNSAWSAPLDIALTPEVRPPELLAFTPPTGVRYLTGTVVQVSARFTEALNPASFATGFALVNAGPDLAFGTADDTPVAFTVSQPSAATYSLDFAQPLPAGIYQVIARTNLTDLAGNGLPEEISWNFGIRPTSELVNGTFWDASSATVGHWSTGRLPTRDEFVKIDQNNDPLIHVRDSVAAYDLTARNPLLFESSQSGGARLNIAHQATFEDSVTLAEDVGWEDGQSYILKSLLSTGTVNFSLSNHILHNHGHAVIQNGVLLRNAPGFQTIIHNYPEATWEQAGSISRALAFPGAEFVNEGLFVKIGPDQSRIDLDRFVNTGSVEVRGGTLSFVSGLIGYGNNQHLGSYYIAAGAVLDFSGLLDFGRSTRIFGPGNCRLSTGPDTTNFPGSIEIGGTMEVLRTTRFVGPINTSGLWVFTAEGSISGLAPQMSGSVAINRNGRMIVDTPSGLRVASLISSNDVNVVTSLQVDGPLNLDAGRLYGNGTLRARGASRLAGIRGFSSGTNAGVLEIEGSLTVTPNASLQVAGTRLRILPAGSFELGTAQQISFSNYPLLNEGSMIKNEPGNTSVLNPLQNRGTFKVQNGTVTLANSFTQYSGRSEISDAAKLVASGSNGTIDIRGGVFAAVSTVQCRSITNSAEVSPGFPLGLLQFDVGTHPSLSVYEQTAAGKLTLDIAGAQPGVQHDQLQVTGRAVLAGTLQLNATAAFDPPLGQELVLLSSAKRQGTFATLVGANFRPGKRFDLIYTDTQVKLVVVASP